MTLQPDDIPNRTAVVEEWLNGHSVNKHVQFAQNVTVVDRVSQLKLEHRTRRSSSADNPARTLFTVDEKSRQSKFLPDIPNGRTKAKVNGVPAVGFHPQPAIIDPTLYRTVNDDAVSVSSVRTSSSFRSHRSLASTDMRNERGCVPSVISSIQAPPSTTWSSQNKERFSTLEFHSSLPDTDRQKLEDIRQITPDEFEKLVPTFIKLGVITIPKKFFEINNEDMTGRELIDRHRLNTLLKQEDDKLRRKITLEELYGSVIPDENNHRKNNLLRESLSFQGQLSLLATYQDEIERELSRKIKNWKSISINNYKTNLSEYSYATTNSSIFPHTYQNKKKSIRSSSTFKSDTDYSLTVNDYLLKTVLPDSLDYQWRRKLIVNIIEQAMVLLDRIRTLSSISLPSISANELIVAENPYNPNQIEFIKAFKRWSFLCSTLYSEY